MGVTIRPALEAEAPLLAELQKAAFLPLYERYHDEGNPCLRGVEDVADRLRHPDCRYFTVLLDEKVVGGILYRDKGKNPSNGLEEFYLQRVYIKPECQSQGIARRAILLCEEELPGAEYFSVDFPEDLEKNRRCYEKAGYRDTGRRLTVQPGLVLARFEKRR